MVNKEKRPCYCPPWQARSFGETTDNRLSKAKKIQNDASVVLLMRQTNFAPLFGTNLQPLLRN
jgi:hypothetical protein